MMLLDSPNGFVIRLYNKGSSFGCAIFVKVFQLCISESLVSKRNKRFCDGVCYTTGQN